MIQSLLDNDLYSFTQQQAVLELYPAANVEYRFTNRRKTDTFSKPNFDRALREAINKMQGIRATPDEIEFLQRQCPFLKPHYLAYLANYSFDPKEVQFEVKQNGDLELSVCGPWHSTILWEVPLLATISEIYFQCKPGWDMEGQATQALNKGMVLQNGGCFWADFGTRRRRNYDSQRVPVKEMKRHANFVGTSNVHLACKYNIRPIGTMSHQWIMGVSVLEGLRHANRHALRAWRRVYNGNLGIALTDTYGSEAFWNDFDLATAKLYDGVRHDSGDPFSFADDAIAHYEKLNILPETKTIVFSDSLNVEKAVQLQRHCGGRIKCSFGIGTHFSNDFPFSEALNMVIKLWSLNGIPVVKLSDDIGKAQGDPNAVAVANWTFRNKDMNI